MWTKIVRNTAWLSGGELIARLTRAVLVIIAARILGAVEWGTLSYALSLAALFTVIADIGISSVLTRELVKHPDQQSAYLSTSFFIKLTLATAAALIIIFIAPYFSQIALSPIILLLAGLLVISDNLALFNNALIRSLEKMHLEAAGKIVTQTTILAVGLFVLWYSASAENLALAYLIGSITGATLIAWLLRHWLKKLFVGFNKHLAKKILNASWPFALMGMVGGIMLNTDIVMLGWFRSAADIGYYSISQRGILLLYAIPTLITTATFPSLARLAKTNKEDFTKVLSKSLQLIFLLALPITIFGIIASPKLIDLIFGPEYLAATTTLRLLLLTIPISYPAILIGNALFAHEKQKEFLKYSAISAGSNVIFNLMLIPTFGIEGAAVATIITQVLSNSFIWIKLKKLL